MRRPLLFALFAALPLPGSFAADTPVPIYPVDQTCERWNSPEMPNGAAICVEMEQNLYDGLKLVWPDTPEYVRAYCVQQSATASMRSDVGLIPGRMPPLSYQMISDCMRPDARGSIPRPSGGHFTP